MGHEGSLVVRRDESTLAKKVREEMSNALLTQADIARRARIGPIIITYLLDGNPFKEAESPRGHQSRIEVLCRLARYLRMSPIEIDAALAELGVRLNDPRNRATIDSALRETVQPRLIEDPVVSRIWARYDQRSGRAAVHVGLLEGAPSASPAFSDALLRRLIPTLNKDWEARTYKLRSVRECIDSLVSGDIDMLLGLFDHPARRSLQIEFVALSGLHAPISAIHILPEDVAGEPRTKSSLLWADVINSPADVGPIVAVLHEEVGHLHLLGPGGFSTHRNEIREIELVSTEHIVDELLKIAESLGFGKPLSRQLVFVAESYICKDVHRRLEKSHYPVRARKVRTRLDKKSLSIPMPSYPVCVAVRADALQWVSLIERAVRELFHNGTVAMADLFADFFLDHNDSLAWDWAGKRNPQRALFKKAVEVLIDNRSKLRPSPESGSFLPAGWNRTWQRPLAKRDVSALVEKAVGQFIAKREEARRQCRIERPDAAQSE